MHRFLTLTLPLGAGLGVLLASSAVIGTGEAHAAKATPAQPLTYDPRVSLAPLVKTLAPTVVHIKVPKRGEGSGFIISADGLILTNNHVLGGAKTVNVTLSDDRTVTGEVLGTDPRTDVALVRITAPDLSAATLGSSDDMEVGDWLIAIGNPFGLDHSVSAGILSGKGRRIGAGPYDAFLQTDASINPGNSGGPLFNLSGEVVGINTAVIGQGIGFAVPIDMVEEILDELKTDGAVARGWIGVSLRALTPELAERLDLPDRNGVVVQKVHEGTPAFTAKLQHGDVVRTLDGVAVADTAEFIRAIGRRKPGEKVKLGIIRGGEKRIVNVALGERPSAI
jgi:serine protease Do